MPKTAQSSDGPASAPAATHEPLSAIIAEMCDFCSGWSEDVDVTVKVGLIYGWKCRIEAAYKRERAITDIMLAVKDKPLPHPDPDNAPPLFAVLVNAAAMTRAQLQTIADLVAIAHDEYDGLPSYRDDLERFDRLLVEIKSEAQSGTGNAAAIRAALEATLRMTPPLCDVDAARIRAILAVPARNVDRPECRTRDEAWKVFERESAGMWAADWDAAFTAWLFDTKEEGAK